MSKKRKSLDVNQDRRSFLKSVATTGAIATIAATHPVPLVKVAEAASDSSTQSQVKKKYPHLFSSIKIAGHTYKNRILCSPVMFAFYCLGEDSAERIYKMVEGKAKGGVAQVTCGEQPINFADAASTMVPGLDVDWTKKEGPQFEAYKRYADVIKRHNAIALIQIFHGGIRAGSPMNKEKHAWGPMSYVSENGVIVDAFDSAKMNKVCNDFATCADFMKAAGFDGINIHGGHGYLFTQFLSPTINQRTDRYGGSVENRGRFPREILSAIRNKAGSKFIIELRLNGADSVEGGTTAAQTAEFCSTLDGLVDIIHITNGLHEDSYRTHTFSSHYDPHGVNVERAAIVKEKTNIPVTVVGGINDPDFAEKIIAEGKVDFVSLGRQLIADPDFANKARDGRENEIRRCMRCYRCYGYREIKPGASQSFFAGGKRTLGSMMDGVYNCSINPRANKDLKIEAMPKPKDSRKVLVVGGGPGGMQAAITACDRGHRVTLIEKEGSIGGVLKYTDTDIHKVDLRKFKNLLIGEVERRKIEVWYNTEATPDLVSGFGADAVILAIGASPGRPKIPGIENAIHAIEAYTSYGKVGKKVVMIGGGLRGCETAIYLADKGHNVIIVEMLDRLVSTVGGSPLDATIDQIEKRCNIDARTSTRCTEITLQGLKVEDASGKSEVIQCDTVVYSHTMDAKRTEVERLRSATGKAKVFEVGDCVRGANVYEAVSGGFMAAMEII
jgi:2,4-dienoyl-CoA reductase-like NADH-dependent reductase (Old Yellow Enzyme family)/thioredoxin reductase